MVTSDITLYHIILLLFPPYATELLSVVTVELQSELVKMTVLKNCLCIGENTTSYIAICIIKILFLNCTHL